MQLDLDNKEWQDALQIINYTRARSFSQERRGRVNLRSCAMCQITRRRNM